MTKGEGVTFREFHETLTEVNLNLQSVNDNLVLLNRESKERFKQLKLVSDRLGIIESKQLVDETKRNTWAKVGKYVWTALVGAAAAIGAFIGKNWN